MLIGHCLADVIYWFSRSHTFFFYAEYQEYFMNFIDMNHNVIIEKTFDFALSIVFLSQRLKNQKDFVISDQLLKSGTSIGANVEEAQGNQSKADFLLKISIALKEAYESRYWLKLLLAAGKLEDEEKSLLRDADELIRILRSIQFTLKQSLGRA